MSIPSIILRKSLDNRGVIRTFLRINQCSVRHHNFDGEAYSKTSLNLLTKEDDGHTYIEAFSPIGFRLSSGLRILGPCALFPKSVLHWNVASSERISPDSLSLFSMLEPKPDILIIGIGNRGAHYDKNIIRYLRSKRINVEILPTEQACSTFNFLNAERRVVAAALIPPTEVDSHADNLSIADMQDEEASVRSMEAKEAREGEMEDPFLAGVTKKMESFNEHGMVNVVSQMDRERERTRLRGREEDEKDDEEYNKNKRNKKK